MENPVSNYWYRRSRSRSQFMYRSMYRELAVAHRRVETMYMLLCNSTLNDEHLYVARVINAMRRLQWIENLIDTINRSNVLQGENENMVRIQDQIFMYLQELGYVHEEEMEFQQEFLNYDQLWYVQRTFNTD